MQWNEQQAERIARWLDGEDVALTDAERADAEALRNEQQAVGRLLDAAPPRRAMDRARRRLLAELARPQRRKRRIGILVGAAAAAVILIVATAALVVNRKPTAVIETQAQQPVTIEELVEAARQSEFDDEIDLLAGEVDRLRAEMVVSTSAEDDFWLRLDETLGDTPAG